MPRPSPISEPIPTAEARRRLLGWYRRKRRELPWRQQARADDAYAVWVAEIMLQQTRVETVIPYYERFLARFPNTASLAAAPVEEVLRLWSGLGYYRRARQLHRAARLIVTRHGGHFPLEPEAARRLPGVGEYTTGAVLSIAGGWPLPAVDANARRVYGRLLGGTAGALEIQAAAARLISRRRPGEFNQAVMDLGATICRPANPDCPSCPWRSLCRAAPWTPKPPISPRPQSIRMEPVYALWRRNGGQIRLVRRAATAGWMPGLWELPAAPPNSCWPEITSARHQITHHAIRARLLAAPAGARPPAGGRWQPVSRLHELALTGLARKLLIRLVDGSLS